MPKQMFGQRVLNQEIALDTYLSTLLEDIPNDLSVAEELRYAGIAVKEVEPQKKITPVVTVVSEVKEPLAEKVINPLAIMPEWTQGEFQALFFKVDKLILAAPLTELLRTIRIDKQPTKIPGQPSWFMGLLDTHEQRIGVLDTGQLILGKNLGQQRDLEKKPFKTILISGDGRWGLACDEILSIGKLEPEKVRWRTVRQKRPWLIGTVIDELTAIIDVERLVPHRKAS